MNTKINIIYSIIFFLAYSVTSTAQIIRDSTSYNELRNSEFITKGQVAIINKYNKFDTQKDSVFIFRNGELVLSKKTNYPYTDFTDDKLIHYESNIKEIEILDIKTLQSVIITNISTPIIIKEYSQIFYFDTNTDTYKLIKVHQNNIKEIWSSPKKLINFTSIDDNKQRLLIQYSNLEKGLEVINLSTLRKTIHKGISHSIKHVIWDSKLPVVFLTPNSYNDNKYPYLTFFNYDNNFSKKQDLNKDINFTNVEAISDYSFKITQSYPISNKPYNVDKLEIWSTTDRYLRNAVSSSKVQKIYTKGLLIFDYKENKVYQPEMINNHESIPLNQNSLLVYDSNQYLDYTYKWISRPRDISIYDIKSNKLTLITKAQEDPLTTTSLSPFGNYFIYQKKDTVYFYNTAKRIVENTFKVKRDASKLKNISNRLKYWSQDEKYFYFVSDSSLIKYNTINKNFETIIKSNNIDYHYKILNPSYKSPYNIRSEIRSNIIENNNKLLIEKLDSQKNTTSLLLIEKQKKHDIIKDNIDNVSDVKYSKDFNTITFSLENFNKPKSVFIYREGTTKKLLENTMDKELYTWKKQRIVSYKDKFGNSLQGILFYPKDFTSEKKYPMITKIYEIQNHLSNRFFYPSYYNSDGFNIELYLKENYFVFLPDILDTQQGTGLSALHCVEESLKTVLQEESSIDKNSLGLFGFSHGGYETNFIITQSNLFKTAVSGSGNSDIIRSYFSYNENFIAPFFSQFENGQYKMPTTFKEDKELYLINSPILFTDQIKTPLLTFTGKKDENIHWEQQREFFIAMLRYNIPHIALFYENEGHGLNDKGNQIDITTRMINWFDYFLKNKDDKETKWIKYYTTFEKDRIIKN